MNPLSGPAGWRLRPSKRLHDWREPVLPRPAATVLMLRDSPQGLQMLMARRSMKASFAPGAFVFPGGAVDANDASPLATRLSQARETQTGDQRAFAVAAIRETYEELGVLLARRPDGSYVDDADLARMDRHGDFLSQIKARGWTLAVDAVWWLAHWITDRDLPKRFDARFLTAPMPPGQTASADESETFEPVWIEAHAALDRHARGDFEMIFPTIRTLRRLSRHRTARDVFDACANERPLWTSCPRAGYLARTVERFMEDDPAYGELELTAPDGRIVHRLDWQHEEAVRLTRHVMRLTAPNPGRMTGPGTNTYIVGEPGAYLVIDPGPDDVEHLDRIKAIVADDLKLIVCTHSHPDHFPGAAPLSAATGAPVLGRPSGPMARDEWAFEPPRVLEDGDLIELGDSTLRVLHTPGHASNHLCLLMVEDGLLFSGDHILNGSTTVIDPPDGNMRQYLRSLDRLLVEPFDFILPAHGWVIARGHQAVSALIAHRLAREAKVLSALKSLSASGPVPLELLVPVVYDEIDPILHPVARRSLLAHLDKLETEGIAAIDEQGRWTATAAA